VLDGSGLGVSEAKGVSVNVPVGVIDIVGVVLGTKDVSVTGANEVFVIALVGADVAAIGVDVNVQANDVTIQKINKRCFRLIHEILLYPNDTDVRKFR
jgi:hypothetical protein